MRTLAVLLTFLAATALAAADTFNVPLLDLQQERKEWVWLRDGKKVKDDPESMRALFAAFSKHRDKRAGWAGQDDTQLSDNLLVIHVSATAPSTAIGPVLRLAREAGVKRIAIAVRDEVTSLPDKSKAPDAAELDAAYLLIDTLAEGKVENPPLPALPKAQINVYINYERAEDANSYVVAIDARGRVPVEDSFAATKDVAYEMGETADARKLKTDMRAHISRNLVAAIESYNVKAGDKIEQLELSESVNAMLGANHSPWVFFELAARAAATMNADREKAGKTKLQIRWRFLRDLVEPPPPEQPPEKPLEFPKDEPADENPTEDEHIVPDSEDDVNEDPTDKPNSGLAENPKDDPSDSESPHPAGRAPRNATGFAHRRARGGGGRPHEDRMRAALSWLKDHQKSEGFWSADGFSSDSTRKAAKKTYNIEFVSPGQTTGDHGWKETCDVGLTGLALLAFAGAGCDEYEGDFRPTCRQAILYLRKAQSNDGCFGSKDDDHFVYNHAICTMAMAEIYGLSSDEVLKPIVEKACEFIIKAQNPGLGWRYGVKPGVNDSSVTGWMVLALKSATLAGIDVDTTKSFIDAAEWFKLVTVDVNGYPKVGYDSPGSPNARLRSAQDYDNNPTMDAMYIVSMLSMGKIDLQDKTLKSLAQGCAEKAYLPAWSHHKIDFYYWYYASLALYQVGGSSWKTWEKALFATMLDHQRGWCDADRTSMLTAAETLDEHGSWDPVGAWGQAGGRVYSTAMGALILQTHYRYKRVEDR